MTQSNELSCQLPQRVKAALCRPFERVVVFSGAGLSADSGVPTFRSGNNGLWAEFSPQDMATPGGWRRNKELVWGWYEWRRSLVLQAQPNAGHRAVARLQQEFGASVVTQNVDDLHERGGAEDVLHLHGSIMTARCFACCEPYALTEPTPVPNKHLTPPRCLRCNGFVRPGVVWFGERLPEATMRRAAGLIGECDLLLVIGTSGVVQPAAGLTRLAPESAVIVEINSAPSTGKDPRQLYVPGAAALVMPEIRDVLLAHRHT